MLVAAIFHPVTHPAHSFLNYHLKLRELLDCLACSGEYAEDIESDGLGEGPALTNCDPVTDLDTECW